MIRRKKQTAFGKIVKFRKWIINMHAEVNWEWELVFFSHTIQRWLCFAFLKGKTFNFHVFEVRIQILLDSNNFFSFLHMVKQIMLAFFVIFVNELKLITNDSFAIASSEEKSSEIFFRTIWIWMHKSHTSNLIRKLRIVSMDHKWPMTLFCTWENQNHVF